MPSAKISALTALDSTANLAQLYIPLFKADGSPDNPRILASDLLLAADGVNITPAWSGTGTATTPLLVNVTADPGPANAASKLLDLQVGGSSLSYFRKDGALHVPSLNVSGAVAVGNLATNSGLAINSSLGWVGLSNGSGGGLRINSSDIWLSKPLGFTSVATHDASLADVVILRDAADILAQRRSTNGNTLKVYRTYTSSSTFERGTFGWHDSSSDTGVVGTTLRIGSEKGSVGGTARDVAIITDGTARVTYGASGGETKADGHNVTLGTTTGTKIGTATGEKLGFWNATPVVQQVLATGGGATVDNVITLLQTLGLCKQS